MSTAEQGSPAAIQSPPSSEERWALGDPSSHARLWIVAVVGLVADLWSKNWAIDRLKPGDSLTVIKNLCSLRVSLNPGALFGIGAGMAPIFVGASVLALMFVLYLFAHSTSGRRSMHIALGLVLAGAVGNLYDRTTQSAFVVHYPNGHRAIGTLASETEMAYVVGDFPTGHRPQVYPRSSVASAGMEPVVRDFIAIEAQIGRFALWPWIFNIADALLVVGVGMLLLNFWSDRHGSQHAEQPDDTAASA